MSPPGSRSPPSLPDGAHSATSARPLTGDVVVGPYRLLRQLGEGADARVFLARHQDSDRECAIKVPRCTDPAGRLAILREARLLARLRHPNVVSVREVLSMRGAPALVMDFVGTSTLADQIALSAMPEARANAIFAQICDGVAAAHRLGIVHRDLKPSNILLTGAGGALRARVADFGLGLDVKTGRDDETASATWAGTLAYSAPELHRLDARPTTRSDVFSLGCLYYELLTGQRAFEASAPLEVIEQMQQGAWRRPADVSPLALSLLELALAPNPGQRAKDADALVRRLRSGGGSARALARWVAVAGAVGLIGVLVWRAGGGATKLPAAAEAREEAVLLPAQAADVVEMPAFSTDPSTGRVYQLISERAQTSCARELLLSEATKPRSPTENLRDLGCLDHVAMRVSEQGSEVVITSGCGLGRTYSVPSPITKNRRGGPGKVATVQGRRLSRAEVQEWLSGDGLLAEGAAADGVDPWAATHTPLICPYVPSSAALDQPVVTSATGALALGAPTEPYAMIWLAFLGITTAYRAYTASMDDEPIILAQMGYELDSQQSGWLASWTTIEDPAGRATVHLLAVHGADLGRHFTFILGSPGVVELPRLTEPEIVTLLTETPHIGGTLADLLVGPDGGESVAGR